MLRFIWCLLGGALLLAGGCGRNEPETASSTPPAADTNRQVFQVRGVVQAVRPRQKEVEIKHEAIPGYMPAMTMPFDVKDTNELAGLEPGERVSFRLVVTATEGWVEQLRKIGPQSTNGPPPNSSVRLAREVEPLEPGDPLPVYQFTNQFGQPFSTAAYQGQALAITFLFTRCPFPNFCPRMANNFEAAQQKLLSGSRTNWQLLTISFDPEFDRPAVLKAYAEAHHYDPAHWTFATGDLVDITAIAEQFGMAFWHDETGSISHNLRTAVVDARGKVQKVFVGNEWTGEELVKEMELAEQK